MQIVSFSEFARRRGALGRPDIPADAGPALPVTDRWAALHAPASAEAVAAEVLDFEAAEAEADFWSDLQFRIAYPTHRMRRH
ncbi:MAG TPA: hypothetical protein PKA55_05610 [Rhodoblastus sp.]|nr:hypothetical protein [Rhodoblastus sp.]